MPAPRDQPRWPRGSPDDPEGHGKGGRWRSRGDATTWTDQLYTRIAGRPSWADRGLIARLAFQRPVPGGRLSGGSIAQTEQLRYPDGQVAVRKIFHDDGKEGGEERAVRRASAEYLAPLVGDAVGVVAPAVVKDPTDPEHAVIMGRVTGDLGAVHTGNQGEEQWGQALMYLAETDAGMRIGLMDVLIGNRDRHSLNWFLSNELDTPFPWGWRNQEPLRRPIPIDHSETFQDTYSDALRLRPIDRAGREHTAPLEMGAYRGFFSAWLQPPQGVRTPLDTIVDFDVLAYREKNPLHPDDVPVLRARLEKLRPQFANEDMLDQYQLMMRRFGHLARRAGGTVRMFPDE